MDGVDREKTMSLAEAAAPIGGGGLSRRRPGKFLDKRFSDLIL